MENNLIDFMKNPEEIASNQWTNREIKQLEKERKNNINHNSIRDLDKKCSIRHPRKIGDKNENNDKKKSFNKKQLEISSGNKEKEERTIRNNISTKVESDDEQEDKEDTYKESVEEIYHNKDNMLSAGVLEDEKHVMDDIISFKKQKCLDYNAFLNKNHLLDEEIQKLKNLIIDQVLSLDGYRERLRNELNLENQLLKNAQLDKSLNPDDKKIVEKRINKRIEIINNELQEEIQDAEEKCIDNINNYNIIEDKPKPKERVDQNYSIDINNSNNFYKNFNSSIEIIAKKTSIIISENPLSIRLKELEEKYKACIRYFQNNELSDQEDDAIKKLLTIHKAIKLSDNGKKFNEDSLPKNIHPDFICGMNKKERFDTYTSIIKEISHLKKDLINDKNKALERFNMLSKKEQIKIKDHIKTNILDKDAKINKYDALCNKLMESLKNPWIPCPKVQHIEEEESKEKVLEDIPDNTIVISFDSTNYKNHRAYLSVNLETNENKKYSDHISIKEIPHKISWRFEKNEFIYLYRKSVDVTIHTNKNTWTCFCFRQTHKSNFKVKLDQLKSKCQIISSYDIPFANQIITPKFNLTISIRTPCIEKEYIYDKKEVIKIVKVYPEFKLEQLNNNVVGKKIENKETKKKHMMDEKKNTLENKNSPVIKKNIQLINHQNIDKQTKEEIIDESLFTIEEIDDPDYIDNMNSLKVMEKKINQMNEQIKKIEGRPPQKLRQKFLQTKVRYNALKEQISENTVTVDNYIVILNKQIEKDKKLSLYFKQHNNDKKFAIVNERILIMLSELGSLIKEIKKTQN